MRDGADEVLARHGGAASRAQLGAVLTRNQLDDEIARGHLEAIFPRVYARPWDADMIDVRRRAALLSVGGAAALSHVTALQVYRLLEVESHTIHVTTTFGRHPLCASPDLVVHRTRLRTKIHHLDGLAVVPSEVALVTTWSTLPAEDRRGPTLEALRRGLVTPQSLRDTLLSRRGLAGRAAQLRLAALLAEGCESELELWGLTSVFDVSGLRHGVRQLKVPTASGVFRLDLAFPDVKVAVELDGWRFHSSREQRERDMRRDAALAAAGWIVLRFSHQRLHADVAGCRRDVLSVLAQRRRAA